MWKAEIPDETPPCQAAGEAPTTGVSVKVTAANVMTDSITISLQPAGLSGNLQIKLTGPSGTYTAYNATANGNTSNNYSFNMGSAPAWEFTGITATWSPNGTSISSASYPYHIRNLGSTRQTGYNSPAENVCGGTLQNDMLFDNACHQSSGNLLSGFITAVTDKNAGTGSGHSNSYGDVHWEQYCSGRSSIALRTHYTITGSLGSLSNSTVAVCATGPDYVLGATLFVVGTGLKTVSDSCPACCLDSPHIDQYSTVTDCPWVGPSPTHAVTVRIY